MTFSSSLTMSDPYRSKRVIRRRILLTTDVVGGVWDFCLVLGGGLAAADCDVTLLALGSPSA